MGDAVVDSCGALRAWGDVLVGDPPCGVAPAILWRIWPCEVLVCSPDFRRYDLGAYARVAPRHFRASSGANCHSGVRICNVIVWGCPPRVGHRAIPRIKRCE